MAQVVVACLLLWLRVSFTHGFRCVDHSNLETDWARRSADEDLYTRTVRCVADVTAPHQPSPRPHRLRCEEISPTPTGRFLFCRLFTTSRSSETPPTRSTLVVHVSAARPHSNDVGVGPVPPRWHVKPPSPSLSLKLLVKGPDVPSQCNSRGPCLLPRRLLTRPRGTPAPSFSTSPLLTSP